MYLTPSLFKCHHYFIGQFFDLLFISEECLVRHFRFFLCGIGGKKKEPTHGLPRLRASQVSAAQPLKIIYLKPSKMSNGFYESGNNILWSNSQFILICFYKLFSIFLRQFQLSPFSYFDISAPYRDRSSLVCASSFSMIRIVGKFNGVWHQWYHYDKIKLTNTD